MAALLIGGCHPAHIKNPNDPNDAEPGELAEVFHRNIATAADNLNARVVMGDLTDSRRRELLADYAAKLLETVNTSKVGPEEAWIYADLCITARQYRLAEPLLIEAVKYATAAKNDDRRVNDSLRLARVLALNSKVKEGLDLAQKVIDSHPSDPGPVLPSVLLEITPAAEGKGNDLELANLLKEAIRLHLTMQVDPASEAGQAFLYARPFHIRNAWKKIIDLYLANSQNELAKTADSEMKGMMATLPIYSPRK